jgi:hypothetical protein
MGSKTQPARTPDLFLSATLPEQDRRLPQTAAGMETRELGDAVGRRTRSAIALGPILEVERTKVQRELDLSAHDLRMLCLVILDVVIDKMGFGTGAGPPTSSTPQPRFFAPPNKESPENARNK